MKNQKQINKLKLSEKLMLASFMEVCPKIIELWKKKCTDLSFDEWLLSVIRENKKNK